MCDGNYTKGNYAKAFILGYKKKYLRNGCFNNEVQHEKQEDCPSPERPLVAIKKGVEKNSLVESAGDIHIHRVDVYL